MDEKYKNIHTGKIVTIVKTERVNYDEKLITVYVLSNLARWESTLFYKTHTLVQDA